MKQVITMHGWCGNSDTWKPWQKYFEAIGYLWQNGDRGYCGSSSLMPDWHEILPDPHNLTQRILICHSLGIHLVEKKVLEQASHVILVCSFSQFIPDKGGNRALEVALKGMRQALGTEQEQLMIQKFLEKANEPYSIPIERDNTAQKQFSQNGRARLIKDLDLLINTKSLPNSLSRKARVLVINGLQDSIIAPATRRKLINDLTKTIKEPPICWNIKNAGHALSHLDLTPQLENWINENQ